MEHLDIKTEDESILVPWRRAHWEWNELWHLWRCIVYSIDIKEELENVVEMHGIDMIRSEDLKDLLFKENNSEIENLADKKVVGWRGKYWFCQLWRRWYHERVFSQWLMSLFFEVFKELFLCFQGCIQFPTLWFSSPKCSSHSHFPTWYSSH